MIDIILLFFGIIFIIIGLIGCIIPVLPGPPLSFLGMLFLHFSKYCDFNAQILWISGGMTVIVSIIDYIIPIWGTKRFGGSKRAVFGATIGLIIGLFFGPLGIILGPFIGAFVGEFIGNSDIRKSLKAAIGSFFGIFIGTVLKLMVSGLITYYILKELFFHHL